MEKWKPILGYEGIYKVSDHGRVRSVSQHVITNNRYRKYRRFRRGKLLTLQTNTAGNTFVVLYKNKKYKTHMVGRLVLKTFSCDPLRKSDEACNIDGDKTKNHIHNLTWVSKSKRMSLENNPNSKLTKDEVRSIYKLLKNGETRVNIAKMFGVSRSAISFIENGRSWRYITGISRINIKDFEKFEHDLYSSCNLNDFLPAPELLKVRRKFIKFKEKHFNR